MSHRRTIGRQLALFVIVGLATAISAYAKGPEDLAGPLRVLASKPGVISPTAADRLGVLMVGNKAAVTIYFRSEAGAAATSLAPYGGEVKGRVGRRVEALVPVDQLLAVACRPQVAQVLPTPRLMPLQAGQIGYGAIISQGVQMTNATAFFLAGITGTGVKVAVIDTGFVGLNTNEVPVNPARDIVDLRQAGQVPPLGNTNHGAAVAEIVADMAPSCQMTLILVDTPESVNQAVDYIIQQGIKIVNMSLGLADGPFNGTHPVSQAVNRAANAGVLWINAAGNWAQRHWEGDWTDRNNDGYLEFISGKDYIALDLTPGVFYAYLSWYDTTPTGQTGHDYDLVLTDDQGNFVARSAVTQDGDDPPQERLVAVIATAGTYRLRVQRMSPVAPGEIPDHFHLFTPDVDVEPSVQVTANSLAIPAEAVGAYAVGAVRGSTLALPNVPAVPVDRLEPYSSRGPAGSNAKPNLVAPDFVSTSITGYNPFPGTSAAAPHVAGAAALLLAEDSTRTAGTLKTLLERLARKYVVRTEIPEADINGYGAGRLQLRVGVATDSEPPVVTISFPLNNTIITTASPRILASITDRRGVDPATIQVWLDEAKIISDGQVVAPNVTDYAFDTDTGRLTFIIQNMTRTRHTLRIQASDWAGNVSAPALTNFRITTPTIAAGLHLLSLPYPDIAAQSPADVFGLPLESLAVVRWVPADSRVSKYHIYPDEYATFAPPDQLVPKPPAGLGYFVSLLREGVLNVTGSAVTDETYPITLVCGSYPPRGWNLIGNPFESYVDWGSAEFISANGRQDLVDAMRGDSPVTDGVLFEFVSTASGGYYDFASDPTQATMAPLKGYWLHVYKDCTLVLSNANIQTSATRRSPMKSAQTPQGSQWLLRLEARAGAYADPANYIGVSAAASEGYDIGMDVAEPPALVDTLRLYMPSAAGNLAKDMRGAVSPRQTWEVEVACRLAQTPITISWPTVNSAVPRGVRLWLEDKDSGARVYMRTATEYTFQMSEPGVRRLRVIAEAGTGGGLSVSSVSTAAVAGGQLMITYAVSQPANVALEIRNIAGVLIRNLGERWATAGAIQTALWNGQSDRGTRVPPGRYLLRLTARTEDGQSVQVIRPLTLTGGR